MMVEEFRKEHGGTDDMMHLREAEDAKISLSKNLAHVVTSTYVGARS